MNKTTYRAKSLVHLLNSDVVEIVVSCAYPAQGMVREALWKEKKIFVRYVGRENKKPCWHEVTKEVALEYERNRDNLFL